MRPNLQVTKDPKYGGVLHSERRRILCLATLLIIVVILVFALPSPALNWVKEIGQDLFETCQEAGPLPFFTMMALLPIVGFPLAPFIITAGPLFGPSLGLGTVITFATIAVMVNVGLSYWLASHIFRPVITRLIARLGYQTPDLSSRSSWIATLIIRVVPGPPFFLQSYLLALIGVPFRPYMIVSTLIPFGYIASFVLFGDAIARGDPIGAAGAAVLLFVVGGIIHQLRRRWDTHSTSPMPNDAQ